MARATSYTSPRLRGEVDARSAAGKGGSRQAEFLENPPHPDPLPASGERERTERAVKLRKLIHHHYACIERRTRSTMRSTVGSAMSSKMSAAGSGMCGVVIRTGGPSRS
jgi:hypothetical protein